MKLKSLQIKGFKSFANETHVHFNEPITGIVGPNGSGKSNIIDAIRWVLGEQKSKGLRLEKMLDVIFNGTKNKKKASMAQVSLLFENSKNLIPLEYDEVKISRILYDTNESEYRINDVPCRLKDIRNLFLNTGIGSNSYAIIELGMVDDILMDKEHARRRMFEQAAGIAKYKVRKHETLNKLKSTQGDLNRIEDILFELEANLKTLERQAKRTQKYYDLKEEYKDLSIKRSILGQKEALEKEQKEKSVLLELNERYNQSSKEIHELEATIEKDKKDNLDNEQMLSERQKEFNEIVDLIRSKESELEIKKQNADFLNQNKQRAEAEKAQFSNSLEEVSTLIARKREELAEKQNQTENLQQAYNKAKEEFENIEAERLKLQGENTSGLDKLKALESEKFELEKSVIEIQSQLNNADQNSQAVAADLENLRIQSSSLTGQKSTIDNDLAEANIELDSLKNQLQNIERQREELSARIESEKNALGKDQRRHDALNSEYKLLKDMIDNFEGFPESARFLSRQWEEPKPLLSDIIDCDEQYREAIELYLEPYLSYFVLDNVYEAKQSIGLLKSAQKGKAQFFILSSFDDEMTNVVNLSQYGSAAINVVRTAPKYQALLHHLLYNVVLVNNENILIDKLPDDKLIYLSTKGDTNRTKYTISGGSIGLFDGKRIGRKNELERIKSEINDLTAIIENRMGGIDNLKDQFNRLDEGQLKQEISTKTELLNALGLKKKEIDTRFDSLSASIGELTTRLSGFDGHQNSAKGQILSLTEQLTSLNSQISEQNNLVTDQSGMLDDISQTYSQISSNYNNSQLDWVKLQNEIENINNEINLRNQQKLEYESKINLASEDARSIIENEEKNKGEIKELNQMLFEQYKVRDEKQSFLTDTEQKFFANRNVIVEKEDKLRGLNKRLQNQQIEINQAKDRLTSIEFELHSVKERLQIEFNIDLSTLDLTLSEEEVNNAEAIVLKYDKIKKRLDNYGEINPMAVDAYNEINERYVAMKEQRDDILEAEASLKATIKEIDNDATDKFLEAFHKVRENFKDVFRSLFSDEDDCDLILLSSESPLDSLIEIVAQPKGKKPKVLSQLSGGEKTLTAIALLFSLYLLKPAPFCIFDEVDAPLDDINIIKFAKLIKKFSGESQFIIVTHNKSTMAGMDTLYGVYMQEQGISGISQVDFRDYEHNETVTAVSV